MRVFHRVWLDEPIPPEYEENWDRLKELHPAWEMRSWTSSAELLPLLKNRELFESFTAYPAAYALRADVARYEILAAVGGIYVDTDVEPLRPFDDLLGPEPFIAWCSDKELDPAVIGSPPHHPAIELLVRDLAGVKAWRDGNRPCSPPGTTGPTYVTARWRHRQDVRRLPPITFFPYHWQEKEPGRARPPWPAESYAVHRWRAGWKQTSSTSSARSSRTPARSSAIRSAR